MVILHRLGQVTALFRRAEKQLKQLMAESAGLTQAEATVCCSFLPTWTPSAIDSVAEQAALLSPEWRDSFATLTVTRECSHADCR